MVAVAKATPKTGWFTQLNLVRPRFVYLWVRVKEIPVPVFLFAPLVTLEFFLMVGLWIIRRSQGRDAQTTFVLRALEVLRGQTGELRKMPPFALLEVEVKPKALDANAPQQVCIKIGLW